MKKLKICDSCGKPKIIWRVVTEESGRKRYCHPCWSCHSSGESKPKPTGKQKKLRPRSRKRQKEEVEYSRKRKIFLQDNPVCQMNIPGCTGNATDVHHKAGRNGDDYLDVSKWKPACRSCHTWVENNPKEARELGFSSSKL